MERGDRREPGLEWPYVPSRRYDHRAVARNVIARSIEDSAAFPTYVTNTHQDQDYADPNHLASVNLQTIFQALRESASELGIGLSGATIAGMCDRGPQRRSMSHAKCDLQGRVNASNTNSP